MQVFLPRTRQTSPCKAWRRLGVCRRNGWSGKDRRGGEQQVVVAGANQGGRQLEGSSTCQVSEQSHGQILVQRARLPIAGSS
jgi:hypothetical protein